MYILVDYCWLFLEPSSKWLSLAVLAVLFFCVLGWGGGYKNTLPGVHNKSNSSAITLAEQIKSDYFPVYSTLEYWCLRID